MKCTGAGKQTELEFAYSLRDRGQGGCCGPLVSLRLRGSALKEITAALDCFSATHVLSRAEQGAGKYEMCAGHWYDVSLVLGAAGEAHSNSVWESFKTSLFVMTSKGAGWDYKEMYNRFTSVYRDKLAGNH